MSFFDEINDVQIKGTLKKIITKIDERTNKKVALIILASKKSIKIGDVHEIIETNFQVKLNSFLIENYLTHAGIGDELLIKGFLVSDTLDVNGTPCQFMRIQAEKIQGIFKSIKKPINEIVASESLADELSLDTKSKDVKGKVVGSPSGKNLYTHGGFQNKQFFKI